MNRYGLILDEKINLHPLMVKYYVGPISSTLFPEMIQQSDTEKIHAFTVRYKKGEDRSLALHVDTSQVTLNVNINNPEEEFTGSDLYFYDIKDQEKPKPEKHFVNFESGMALIHLGKQMHAACPIMSGERTNLIVWMYRQYDKNDKNNLKEKPPIRREEYPKHLRQNPQQRWGN